MGSDITTPPDEFEPSTDCFMSSWSLVEVAAVVAELVRGSLSAIGPVLAKFDCGDCPIDVVVTPDAAGLQADWAKRFQGSLTSCLIRCCLRGDSSGAKSKCDEKIESLHLCMRSRSK